MTQQRGEETNWEGNSESPGRRRLRRIFSTCALITIAVIAYITGLVRNWVEIGVLTLCIVVLTTVWRRWREQRDQRRWRRDSPTSPSRWSGAGLQAR
jgi:lysylphosphatidylglycerol synthetase-like protein (DUF2156 family)